MVSSVPVLQIARGIVDKVAMLLAITVGPEGEANARVVQTSKLSDNWTVRFMTDRRIGENPMVFRDRRMITGTASPPSPRS